MNEFDVHLIKRVRAGLTTSALALDHLRRLHPETLDLAEAIGAHNQGTAAFESWVMTKEEPAERPEQQEVF